MPKGDFLIDLSFLDDNQQKDINQIKRSIDSGTIEELKLNSAVYDNFGKLELLDFDGNFPFLLDGEEVLWHREAKKGIFNKKLRAFEVLTNYRAFFYDIDSHQAVTCSLLFGDVVVNNQKRLSESQRQGSFAGVGARGTFAGLTGGTSTSASQNVGDVNIMFDGHIDFTFYSIEDPSGLANLLKQVIKSQNELGKKLDAQRGIKKETLDKDSINCEKCGTLNLRNSKFCNKCGLKLNKPCSKCGKVNPSGSSFCNECGYTLQ